jgi:hypothetical protein
VLLSGCGSGDSTKGTTVKGTLLNDGKALEVNDGTAEGSRGYVKVTVGLVQGDKKSFYADAKADGTFAIEGVEAGEYTLTVQHFDSAAAQGRGPQSSRSTTGAAGGDPRKAAAEGARTGPPNMDRLEGAFDQQKSQIKVKVGTSSPQDLGTIDLTKQETWPK